MSRYRAARQIGGQDAEVAWAELTKGILNSVVEVCGMSRIRSGIGGTVWWSKEVQNVVRAKKIAYRGKKQSEKGQD